MVLRMLGFIESKKTLVLPEASKFDTHDMRPIKGINRTNLVILKIQLYLNTITSDTYINHILDNSACHNSVFLHQFCQVI